MQKNERMNKHRKKKILMFSACFTEINMIIPFLNKRFFIIRIFFLHQPIYNNIVRKTTILQKKKQR
jgi:hypothetical protein